MNNDDFTAILKLNIDEMKENTLSNLLAHDHEYKKLCKLQGKAEAEYLKLTLSTEQKEVITKLLTTTDSQNMEYSTLSYLAGLFDSHNWKKLRVRGRRINRSVLMIFVILFTFKF